MPPRRQADLGSTEEVVGGSRHEQAAMWFDPQLFQRKLIGLRLRFLVTSALGRHQHRERNADAVRCNSAELLGTVSHHTERNALAMQLS